MGGAAAAGSPLQARTNVQFLGWRLDQRELWVKAVNHSAPARMKEALKEVDEDYAKVRAPTALVLCVPLCCGPVRADWRQG